MSGLFWLFNRSAFSAGGLRPGQFADAFRHRRSTGRWIRLFILYPGRWPRGSLSGGWQGDNRFHSGHSAPAPLL